MKHLAVALVGLLLIWPQLLAASPTQAELEVVIRSLEAQHAAALIRERRIADERERRLLADAEARLATAAASQGSLNAQAELDHARTAYTSLVHEISTRDATLSAELAAYRNELLGLTQQASPELLTAYQRFADGDRVAAWPVIDALTEAQTRAIRRASSARIATLVRAAADARTTMFYNYETTADQVWPLWERLAELTPNDFQTQYYLATFRARVGLYDDAQQAAATVTNLARTSGEIARARIASAGVHVIEASDEILARHTDSVNRLRSESTLSIQDQDRLSHLLTDIGYAMRNRRQLAASMLHLRQAIEVERRHVLADSTNLFHQRQLHSALWELGLTQEAQRDFEGARSSYNEALAVVQFLRERDPTFDWELSSRILTRSLSGLPTQP